MDRRVSTAATGDRSEPPHATGHRGNLSEADTKWRVTGLAVEFHRAVGFRNSGRRFRNNEPDAAVRGPRSGSRLPTEAEFQRAAYGAPDGERFHPWGSEEPSPRTGVFDFSSWDPEPAGSHPLGASAWGVEDLVGNGWEWTSTPFEPFPGFHPMPSYPEYSADFFDGEHFVMKGASPVTARALLRPSFRNWFRPRYPYVYATFRCAQSRADRP